MYLINNVHLLPVIPIFFLKKSERTRNCMSFKGDIYQCTYNQDIILNHSQIDIYNDVPQNIDVDSFRWIKFNFIFAIKYDAFFWPWLTERTLNSNRLKIFFLQWCEVYVLSVLITPLCHCDYSWYNEWYI